ncbi:DUF881 domain-containing protein [Candidatus Berkelbacteria bacterium]|nr:DUF881 domain-containing protein [Candidatus Berkelbacteria bacterium]
MITKPAIIIVIAVLAVLVTLQLRSSVNVKQALSLQNQQNLAAEVAQIFADSKKLEHQLTKTEEELGKLESTATSSKDRRETLEVKRNDLQIVTGAVAVVGEGVEIRFEKGLTVSELTDLLNTLRSIGAEAIAINGQRFLWKDGIDNGLAGKPLTLQVIGKKSLLTESLRRRGGILEQIGQPQLLEEHDSLKIPAK